ncbi:alpha-2,8-sialyltransferase 8E-like [Emys orbicularis]|uniref:alpha-2,8-sialyltransferase 8E-like n=1 Tax=Emys orbicularis TaxID=82168 RepID=UPI0031FD7E7F
MRRRQSWVLALAVGIALSFSLSVLWRLQSCVPPPVETASFAGPTAASEPGIGWPTACTPKPSPEATGMDTEQCRELGQELSQRVLPGSPFQGAPYDSCAVVGNGGILHNSGCGPEIDRAQFVIRFGALRRWRRSFAEAMGTYGAPLLLIPAFSFIGFTAVSSQALYTLEDFGSPARAVFMNPEYLAGLDGHWHRRGLRAKRLSSGFMLVNAALELCQHLTLYGFWPFPTDPEGRPLSHHYYDNQPSKPGVHAMPNEFTRYLGMHLQGALRLHLGRCQEGPAGGCAQQGSEGGSEMSPPAPQFHLTPSPGTKGGK